MFSNLEVRYLVGKIDYL